MKAISKLTSFILTLVFFVLMFMIYRLNLIPIKYFLPGGAILSLFVLLLDFKLVRKKTKLFSRIFFNIIAILFIIVSLYGLTYINATYNFMNNLLAKDYEIKNYVVVVDNDSGYQKMNDLNHQTIGYLKTDEYYSKVAKKIKKDIQYSETPFSDISLFVNSVATDTSSAIVLEK